MVIIKYAEEADLSAWMTLVGEVRWNFPGLDTKELLQDYENTLLKNIKRGSALCAYDDDKVVGILLFSTRHNMLSCMAVHPNYRKRGIASRLIKEMLTQLDPTRDVELSTFREDDDRGLAPRALYKGLGFVEGPLTEEFGYPHQRLILPARKTTHDLLK